MKLITSAPRHRPAVRAFMAAGALLFTLGSVHAAASDEDRAYCERQEGPAKVSCLRELDKATNPATGPSGAAAVKPAGGKLYNVVDGNKVDPYTLDGFRTWRSGACDRCHGANQEGMVGPSLITSLKTLSKEDFVATITKGRLEKGMPSFGGNPQVANHVDQLYAYLKGRSDGAITKSKVEAIAN